MNRFRVADLGRWVLAGTFTAVLLVGQTAFVEARSSSEFRTAPKDCMATAVSPGRLERIASGVDGNRPDAAPADSAFVAPDDEILIAVTDTIEQLFACLNAGDRLRAYSLYSDRYLAAVLTGQDLRTIATPERVGPGEQIMILSIENVRQLTDGRVVATVVIDPVLIPVEKIFDFYLILENRRWLIDEVIDEIDFSLP